MLVECFRGRVGQIGKWTLKASAARPAAWSWQRVTRFGVIGRSIQDVTSRLDVIDTLLTIDLRTIE